MNNREPQLDIVISDAVRTPVGRMGGALAPLTAAELATLTLEALVDRTGLGGGGVDDVILGNGYANGEAPAIGRSQHDRGRRGRVNVERGALRARLTHRCAPRRDRPDGPPGPGPRNRRRHSPSDRRRHDRNSRKPAARVRDWPRGAGRTGPEISSARRG